MSNLWLDFLLIVVLPTVMVLAIYGVYWLAT